MGLYAVVIDERIAIVGNWVNIYIHLALAFQEIMTKVHRMCNSDNDIVEGMCQIYRERGWLIMN